MHLSPATYTTFSIIILSSLILIVILSSLILIVILSEAKDLYTEYDRQNIIIPILDCT